MNLDPEQYKCPEHGIDVTNQVKEKLDPSRPDLAFKRQAAGSGPFQVVVICSGPDGGEPHLVTCTGKRTP